MCGSSFARSLGITDRSVSSLRRFDDAYFDFYPYLLKHVMPHRMKGKKVLEVGLGYGTLGQRIAAEGADYLGMDIAPTPVDMMKHRLQLSSLRGNAIQGNFLENTFEADTFDYVVSIGCFHHTGNISRCVTETHRILKPGGRAVVMVYNRFSARQWFRWPVNTSLVFLLGSKRPSIAAQRRAYDASLDGSAAPATEFSSKRDLKELFARFSNVRFRKENLDALAVYGVRLISRKSMLSWLGPLIGLDIYVEAQK